MCIANRFIRLYRWEGSLHAGPAVYVCRHADTRVPIQSINPERKILFATYAVPCITNELRMALRHINSSNPPGLTCSYDALIPDTEGCSLLDLIPSTEQNADERFTVRETLSEVVAALKKMKDPDALEIIRMVVQNRRQEEIAESTGISLSATSRKIRAALHQAVQY